MKKILLTLSVLGGVFLAANKAQAQCSISPNCYVKGDYVEVGVSVTGAYGVTSSPTGYHPHLGGSSSIGFVSDPDKDGWLVSSPGSADYMGDYFVPGSPYEGWDLKANGTTYRFRNQTMGGSCPGSYCANVSYTATATEQTTVWEGTVGSLDVTQKTVVRKTKAYFVIYVDIVNSGSTTVNNIYLFRGLDPDNDQTWPGGGFPTDNTVTFQPSAVSKNCLVVAIGRGYPKQAYLGLGTKDCRAKCCTFQAWPFSGQPDDVYNQTGTASSPGFKYNVGDKTLNADIGIGLVFNLGNLAAGAKTSCAYAYILTQADLDSALGETAPKFSSGGSPYSAYTTFRVCPGTDIPLKIINGGQYQWIWTTTAYPNYMTAPGISTLIGPGGTIPTVTGSKTYPFGAVHGDSCVVTVNGPLTYTATGISTCDTQYMTFYVDTINFSVVPSVTSPVRYCEGETAATLTAGFATGATPNWYTVGTGGTKLPAAPTPSTAFPTGKTGDFDTTSYWVSQTNTAGCETPRARIDVIITRKPAPPAVTPITYCIGFPTEPVTAVGSNLKWYDAATGGTKYSMAPTPLSKKAGNTSYFVSQTNNGCESDRAELVVTISQAVAAFTKSSDSLCGDEVLTLTNGSSSDPVSSLFTSLWTFGDGSSSNKVDEAHSYKDLRGTYKINLLVVNDDGCKDSTTQVVEVYPKPEMSFTASDSQICQGNSVDFVATVTPGYRSITWDFGDGDPSFNTLKVRHSFTKAGDFPVQIKGSYPACPGTGSGDTIHVKAIPVVDLGSDATICPDGLALELKNITKTTADKYVWNTGDTSASIMVRNPGLYSVKAINWKCEASDSILISKSCYLEIPNGFEPNSSDDRLKYFLPRKLMSEGVATFKMQIFDRWGQLLFESENPDGRGWDGNYKGNPSPMGVYVYKVYVTFANGVVENYNGNLTLVR